MQPQQPAFDPGASQSKQKMLIRLIIILAAVTIFILVLSVVFAPDDSQSEKLSLTLARHQEMSRVLEEFGENARSTATKQLVANAQIVLLSGTTEMTSAGVSVSTQQAAQIKIDGIDDNLQEAARNNRFDEVITDFLTSNIQASETDLTSIQSEVKDTKKAEVIQQLLADYDNLF